MSKIYYPILFLSVTLLLVQCKREPLQIHPQISHLTDFESHDGSIHLNISGGKAPYQIQWAMQSVDSVLDGLEAGKYMVTVTDARGRQLADTIIVNQPPWHICLDMEGNSYKTVKVGNQIWMAENLRVIRTAKGDSVQNRVYNDSLSNAGTYGRLYTWNAAMNDSIAEGSQGICPDGWHIPTDKEWETLIDSIENQAEALPDFNKALSLSFAGFYNNSYQGINNSASYWSSTQAHDNAWKRYFHVNLSKAFRYHERKTNAISVRCVKDAVVE